MRLKLLRANIRFLFNTDKNRNKKIPLPEGKRILYNIQPDKWLTNNQLGNCIFAIGTYSDKVNTCCNTFQIYRNDS